MIKHGQPLDYRNLGVPYFQSTGLFVPLPTKKRKKKKHLPTLHLYTP